MAATTGARTVVVRAAMRVVSTVEVKADQTAADLVEKKAESKVGRKVEL